MSITGEGTITEIQPEDQLGWIEMGDGTRVRFGGTACKGFVPEVGMKVKVLGTKPGYGGTIKATGLEHVSGGSKPGAGPASVGGARRPRMGLHAIQNGPARVDDVLLQLVGLADVQDGVHAIFGQLGFEVAPQQGDAIGCKNPWFFAVAKDGKDSKDAFGVYTHPMLAEHATHPWVRWDQAKNTIRHVANDTSDLLHGLLARHDDAARRDRCRRIFLKLGARDEESRALGDAKAHWLPPEDDELRPLDEYLAESDGAEMERGLLAYVWRRDDARARDALRGLYEAWDWMPPQGL